MYSWSKLALLVALSFPAVLSAAGKGTLEQEEYTYPYDGKKFHFGSEATQEEIAGWDRDIRYDGQGAPEGSGSVEDGELLYEAKCAVCHGTFGEGEGRWPKLAGGNGTLKDQLTSRPEKTVGSFWPFASTLLDYIWRSMPYTNPRSLTADEAYAISAYVLNLNEIVEDEFVLDKNTLKNVKMPNAGGFIQNDPRPDTKNTTCMKKCKNPKDMVLQEHIKGVTPTEHLRARIADQLNSQDEQPATSVVLSPEAVAGKSIYAGKCDICHANGVGGAPKIGTEDNAEWKKRLKTGMASLLKHAIEGYQGEAGFMPAKGGFVDLTDDEVAKAIAFMLQSSGISGQQE